MPHLEDQIRADAQGVFENNREALQTLAGKRVLVTGGTGLIGINLMAVLGLVDAHFGLAALTYTSIQDYSPLNGVIHIAAPKAVWMQADLTRQHDVFSLPVADAIIHAAGYGQPAKFMASPIRTVELNTQTLIQLDHHLAPGGRALYLSSSEVYSGNAWFPHVEDSIGTTNPQHPRAAYIEGKRCGEALVAAMNGRDDKVYKTARVSLSYGPGTRQDDERVLNQFIKQALVNGAIRCKDAGCAVRTYNYVSDTVEMLLNILLRGKHAVYNVGGIGSVSIRDLAIAISAYTDTLADFPGGSDQALQSAPANVRSSIERYRAEFGKNEFVHVSGGLQRTIEWQRILYGKA